MKSIIKKCMLMVLTLVIATQPALVARATDEDITRIVNGTPLYSTAADVCGEGQTTAVNYVLSSDEKLAQRLFVGAYDAATAKEIVQKYNVGGLFLAKNDSKVPVDYLKEVSNIKAVAKTPLYVATDQEPTSTVDSLGLFAGKKASDLSSDDVAKTVGTMTGDSLSKYGINMDFAPSVDIANSNNFLTIQNRTISSDPAAVASRAKAYSEGLQAKGIMPVFKHFPGHGNSVSEPENHGDSHKSLPTTPSLTELKKKDLIPYAQLASMNNVAVMMGHLNVPGLSPASGDVPTSIDPNAYKLLRDPGSDYATKGIIITDELHMGAVLSKSNNDVSTAIINSLKAGADMALFNVQSTAEFDGIFTKVKAAIGSDSAQLTQADNVTKSKSAFLLNTATATVKAAADNAATTVTSLTGGDNQEKAFRYLLGKGLTAVQVAGIIGNFMQESNVNPKIIQGGAMASDDYVPQNGVGFGIAQWTFDARQKPLEAFAASKNVKITDLGMQLDFVWKELTEDYKSTLDKLKQQTDIIEATVVFHNGYEGSNDTAEAVRGTRGKFAEDALKLYGGMSPTEGLANSGSCTGSTGATAVNAGYSSPTGAHAGQDTRIVDGFVVFMQCDRAWGGPHTDPYCSSMCAPFSMAMIIENLGQEVNPKEVSDYAVSSGAKDSPTSGSDANRVVPALAKHYNLDYKPIPLRDAAAMKAALAAGGLIIVSGQGASPYTSGGHFVVIRKVTASGNFLIANPNSLSAEAATNEKEYSTDSTLFTEMHSQPYALFKKGTQI